MPFFSALAPFIEKIFSGMKPFYLNLFLAHHSWISEMPLQTIRVGA